MRRAAWNGLTVEAPTGRLYANQMVENAYVRYSITEDVQSQIVPTLEKQHVTGGERSWLTG